MRGPRAEEHRGVRAASLDGKRRWISQQAKKQACFKRFLDILPICDTQQILQLLEVALRMRQKLSLPTLLLLMMIAV